MKWKATCPNCNKKQKRWDFIVPFQGFANACPHCGTLYKKTLKNDVMGAIAGIFMAVLLIFIQAYLNSYVITIFLFILIMTGLLFSSPYWTRLLTLPEKDNTIYRAWFVPFIRFQMLILALILLLAFLSIFALPLLNRLETHYRNWGQEIKKIESTEGLKSAAINQNETLLETLEMLNIVLQNNLIFSFLVSLLLLCNFLFFFKIRHLHWTKAILTSAYPGVFVKRKELPDQ